MHKSIFHLQAFLTRYASRCLSLLKSQCNLMHIVLGLCYSSLAYLYPWPQSLGGAKWYTLSVYFNAYCKLIVFWQDDWKMMRGRYKAVCGTSRLAPMSPELFDIQKSHRSWPPLPCPLISLSQVASLADTYLIGWLHVWMLESNYSVTLNDMCLIGQDWICSRLLVRWLVDLSGWFSMAFVVFMLCV